MPHFDRFYPLFNAQIAQVYLNILHIEKLPLVLWFSIRKWNSNSNILNGKYVAKMTFLLLIILLIYLWFFGRRRFRRPQKVNLQSHADRQSLREILSIHAVIVLIYVTSIPFQYAAPFVMLAWYLVLLVYGLTRSIVRGEKLFGDHIVWAIKVIVLSFFYINIFMAIVGAVSPLRR